MKKYFAIDIMPIFLLCLVCQLYHINPLFWWGDNPQNTRTYNNQSSSKHTQKDNSGTMESSNELVVVGTATAEAYKEQGNTKYLQQDYTGAIKDCNKAIDLDSKYAEAYFVRGKAEIKLYDYTGAIKDSNKAISFNPKFAEAYYVRGAAKNNLQDFKGAIRDYNNAIALNPQLIEAYVGRGMTKYNLKNYSGAIKDYTIALKLDPKNAEALEDRRYAEDKLGGQRGAVESNSVIIAAELIGEYDNNYLAADKKYKGMFIQTTGVINDIGEAFGGIPYITLQPYYGEDYSGTLIQCCFTKTEDLTSLSKGQSITVQGVLGAMTLGIVEMEDCKIIR
jgi:tetratricopeptide (TPR) repeat protein